MFPAPPPTISSSCPSSLTLETCSHSPLSYSLYTVTWLSPPDTAKRPPTWLKDSFHAGVFILSSRISVHSSLDGSYVAVRFQSLTRWSSEQLATRSWDRPRLGHHATSRTQSSCARISFVKPNFPPSLFEAYQNFIFPSHPALTNLLGGKVNAAPPSGAATWLEICSWLSMAGSVAGPQLTALTPPSWARKLCWVQLSSPFLWMMWILPSAEPAASNNPYSQGAN